MEFDVKRIDLEKQSSDCIVTGVFELYHLSPTTKYLNKISKNYIHTLLHHGELNGKVGQTLLLYHVPSTHSERILLIGCGKKYELDERQYKRIINSMINTLNNTGSTDVICFLTELHVKKYNTYWKIRKAIEIINESLYTFDKLKNSKTKSCRILRKIIFNVSTQHDLISGKRAIQQAVAIAIGIKIAKDLGNMPPNICNPAYLASQACKLAIKYEKVVKTNIINEKQMKELGMNAYLAVSKGSINKSLISVIKYKGTDDTNIRPIVLIGKGLTFDTGGISVKSSDNMDEMKYDMCGAGAVYGVIRVAIELNLPLNIIGVLAGCENMIDGRAFRPGDILTTLSGQTVEVLNTDAEGRLVLCDVLTYVERFKPEVVIDIATLTGSCVIALGNHLTGMMSNHNSLAKELIRASIQANDRIWQLPLGNEFQEQLKSNFADMANIGGRYGGAITAGCFLSRFTRKYNWAHLDIAGTAWHSGKTKGATGRPVAMLSQFLLNRIRLNNKQ